MGIVADLHRYFTDSFGSDGKTIMDYLSKNVSGFIISKDKDGGETSNMSMLYSYWAICKKMVDDGILYPKPAKTPPFDSSYTSISHSYIQEELDYNAFDYKYLGFQYAYDKLSPSVFPIIGEKENGKPDIGTSFYIGNHYFVTAKHCIQELSKFKIIDSNENTIPITQIIVSAENENLDIALIKVDEMWDDSSIKNLKLADGHILDDVMSIGYPPIPGLIPTQIAEKAQISTIPKASVGSNVSKTYDYLNRTDCFLISARVKGGNSGSPIFNTEGYVVGILSQLAMDDQDNTTADIMGYGICLPSRYIDDLLTPSSADSITILKVSKVDDNFAIA